MTARAWTLGKAVVGGMLQYVSPSQIQLFDSDEFGGCQRKWVFDKVLGLPKAPTTAAQAAGTALHSQIEHYLRTGEEVLGPLARAGRRFIPRPDPALLIEHPLHEGAVQLRAAGVLVVGFIDLVNRGERWLDDEGRDRELNGSSAEDMLFTVEVVDWKTTSSIADYAKPASELATTQMVTYAEHERLANGPGLDIVRLSHGYFQTRGSPRAEKRSTTISVATVRERWQRIEGVVEKMKLAAGAAKIEDVEPNRDACRAYGGCHYASSCPRSPGSVLSQLMGIKGGDDMSNGLLNRFGKKPAAAPSPEVAAEVEKLKVEEAQVRATSEADLERARQAARAVGIVPADAPKSVPPASALPVPPESLVGAAPSIVAAAAQFEAPRAAPTSAILASPPVADTAKKRTRRAPAVAQPAAVDPPGTMPDAVVEAAVAKTADPPGTTRGAYAGRETFAVIFTVKGLMLLVDVVSSGMNPTDLEPYVRERCRELEQQFGAADIRCAPADSALGFGKWKGALAALVRDNPPADGVYALDDVRESELLQVVVEALRPLCAVYVRGR